MASSVSPDADPTEIDPIGPVSPTTTEEPPRPSPDWAEPPLDINTGIPDPLKRDVIPGELPPDMPLPDK